MPNSPASTLHPISVIISASEEWRAVLEYFDHPEVSRTPFGGLFSREFDSSTLTFMHGGWGKISAAASAQYLLDVCPADLLINLGTCGGLDGRIGRGQVLLAGETLVYDIEERMGDPAEAIAHYSTRLNLSWLKQPYPRNVVCTRLLSADRDLDPGQIQWLEETFNAVAVDWESGAIAWVALRSNTPCLILRGVTDLVSNKGGEAYDGITFFQQSARQIMFSLLDDLPEWLAGIDWEALHQTRKPLR